MSREYVDYLESEFDIDFEQLETIVKLENPIHIDLSPLETNAKDIDYAVTVTFLTPLDL